MLYMNTVKVYKTIKINLLTLGMPFWEMEES